MASYRRRVSFNERLYLAAERLYPAFCIQIVLEGEGAVTPEKLEAAVATAAAANPGSRLVLRGALWWMHWVDDGPIPPVRISEEIERPLSPESGPTCEVVLSQKPSSRIVLRCFHGVMDARGLLEFGEDIFRALRGEPVVGASSSLNDTEALKSLVGKKTRPLPKAEFTAPTGSNSSRSREVVWRRFSVDTVSSGLVAKIATSIAKNAQGKPLRIMIPVDIRNYQPSLRTTANMTYPLFVDVTDEQSEKEIQGQIIKGLAKREPLRMDPAEEIAVYLPNSVLWAFYASWAARQRKTGRYAVTALVSQVVMPNTERFSTGGFRCTSLHFIPQQMDFFPLCVSIVSCGSRSEIVVSMPRSLADNGRFENLCDRLIHEPGLL
jgi:hypothetical protein